MLRSILLRGTITSLPQEQQDDGNNNGTKLSFFERLGQFLRKIVEFFRNLFKK